MAAKKRTRRRRRKPSFLRRLSLVLAAVPLAYLIAALIGSLVLVNHSWTEPEEGVTVYLADNGVHSDIVMPAKAKGLDWTAFVPKSDFAAPNPNAGRCLQDRRSRPPPAPSSRDSPAPASR